MAAFTSIVRNISIIAVIINSYMLATIIQHPIIEKLFEHYFNLLVC